MDSKSTAVRDDDYQGPQCGTAEARARLVLLWVLDGVMHVTDKDGCCARHTGSPASELPEGAELLESCLVDGLFATMSFDGQVAIQANATAAPGDYPGWWLKDYAIPVTQYALPASLVSN
jgi:hypothetical protein